ncbi:mitochondrial inner membrane protease subunit 1-like [Panonychus citri]|uniref:mitochondrial inner membrane protease subunit 1-like n=1 Tax=Panonychus citri TaxID=50023 RepID=UPI002307A823|nr:mitochondrial inner membrane protease subunit 1-like [Panonychus citri]
MINNKTITFAWRSLRALCLAYVCAEYGFKVALIDGPSMKPTLNSNDIVLSNQWTPIFGNVKRSDIVIFRSPMDPKKFHCKRIKGVEGDYVRRGFSSISIPKGHVWVEGDNSSHSKDSRDYGPVPIGLIIGVVFFKVYPFIDSKFLS